MNEISSEHPRAESLRIRKKLAEGFKKGLVTPEGLSAHGRGEAFDYILGEETTDQAEKAIEAGAAELLRAEDPVFSVNGNVAALIPEEISNLSDKMDIKVEVNLFHESEERKRKIRKHLEDEGIEKVFGVENGFYSKIPEIKSHRETVDKRGIKKADTLMVPLEDGDRTEALVKLGRKVVTVDLNPMSRTAQAATVTIVDNIVRAMPILIDKVEELQGAPKEKIDEIAENFDNHKNLQKMIEIMLNRLQKLSSE